MARTPRIALSTIVCVFLAAQIASAAGNDRQIVVPPGWQGAYDYGYAPAIRVGDWVIISGIPAGGEGTYEEKIRRMYEQARHLLQASGATIADVVELTTYHLEPTDSKQFGAEFELYMPVHREYFGDHRPAWSAVGTTALLESSAVVEMRVVAVAGSAENSRVVQAVGEDDTADEENGEPSQGGQ